MSVDKTRINWNVLFRAIRSYSVIVHRELIDDLFLHDRKLHFLHCKTTTSWAISTRKSGRPACKKDPLSNQFHTILFHCAHQENSWRENKPSTQKKYYFFLAALIPALIFGGKNKKAAGQLSKKPKRLRHQIEKYVIEKSIKRAQNKDVRKSQRKS